MSLTKVPYTNGVTVIGAENLNDIQDAIIALENAPAQGLTEDMKQALLQLARKVAYIDDQGQTYYDDLYDAFYPPKTVVLITAVFEQGSTVIYDDTALDDLKQYLTVTARYDDNTTEILADSVYSLSGTLAAGTSTVTVIYSGVTTTFTVAVTARPTLSSITAVYTQSGTVYDTDTLDSLKDDLVVTAHYSDSSTAVIPSASYTLSGTLTEGTSTITVSYGGKTDTFNVTVTASTVLTGYTEVGTPNISGNVFSPSSSGYIKTLDVFSPDSDSWAIRFKVSEGSPSGSFQNVFRSVDASNTAQKAIFIQDRGSDRKLYISSDNSNYDISNAQTTTISANTDVFIEVAFDGTDTYTLKTSSDGETWTTVKTITSNSKVNGGKYIAFGGPIANAAYTGTFYLDTIKIYIGGDLWWQAKA